MTDPLPSLMYEALQLREEINEISDGLKVGESFFSSTSLQLPRFTPSELGFIRMVSWLYVTYYETGKIGTEFLTSLATTYLAEIQFEAKKHRALIQQLRTYCQHNLAPHEAHSKQILSACEDWFFSHCGSRKPGGEDHWSSLLHALIREFLTYFKYLRDALRRIEADPENIQLIEQWSLRIVRYYPPHKFDKIIEEVASDFGRESLDVVRFRARHFDKWKKELELMRHDCDYDRQARSLVETALLSDQQPSLPINGRDIMSEFDIAPGPKVQEILSMAMEIYRTAPCNKENLLAKLSERIITAQA